MIPIYIKRSLEPVLEKAASEFPAMVLNGPRQSGKTKILQQLFGSLAIREAVVPLPKTPSFPINRELMLRFQDFAIMSLSKTLYRVVPVGGTSVPVES
jgi:hypothetical protein